MDLDGIWVCEIPSQKDSDTHLPDERWCEVVELREWISSAGDVPIL